MLFAKFKLLCVCVCMYICKYKIKLVPVYLQLDNKLENGKDRAVLKKIYLAFVIINFFNIVQWGLNYSGNVRLKFENYILCINHIDIVHNIC